jgi:hypothetical protein
MMSDRSRHASAPKNGLSVAFHDSLVVPQELSVRCRAAALAFSNASGNWTKWELAQWLTGPYRAAALPVRRTQDVLAAAHAAAASSSVDDVMLQARVRVVASLEALALSHDVELFARRLVDMGAVVRVRGPGGELGWSPADVPALPLHARVLSLFAADALMNVDEYKYLRVCHFCELVGVAGAGGCDCWR